MSYSPVGAACCEFTNGSGITAAETNSAKVSSFPDLARLENRQYLGELAGAEACVAMRRSDKGPNKLTQTMKDLKAGRLYSVGFVTYDPGKSAPNSRHAVSVAIASGEIVPSLSAQATMADFNSHFTVFRAKADSAVLTISDWTDLSTPGGPIGQELLYDFVQIQPYTAE